MSQNRTSGIRRASIVSGSLVLAVMAMIFIFSCQNGDASSALSFGLLRRILGWFRRLIEAIAGQPFTFAQLEKILRKMAHFSEFALLGFTLMLHLHYAERRFRALWAWVIATLYAVSDEVHQFFIADRAPGVRDVCIDSAGASAGIVVCLLLLWLVTGIRKRRTEKNREAP